MKNTSWIQTDDILGYEVCVSTPQPFSDAASTSGWTETDKNTT